MKNDGILWGGGAGINFFWLIQIWDPFMVYFSSPESLVRTV